MISLESKWVHLSVSVKRICLNALDNLIQFLLYLCFVFCVREIKSLENTKTALIFIVCLPRDSRETQREQILWGLLVFLVLTHAC